jgi:predicted acetyltransferase
MKFELRTLTENDEKAFLEGFRLFSDMEAYWFSFSYKEGDTFKDHLALLDDELHGRNLAPGRVPHTMLYAFLDGKIIGRASIRHQLNDHLIKLGGNVGYAVATNYRNKGYATEILKQSLVYCRDVLKLHSVLVTCDDDNNGSIKTIVKNGGVYENKILNEGKNTFTNRYWIKL